MAEVDIAAFHAALDAHRTTRGLSWRDVAGETGLSASTLTRMAGGQKPCLDGAVTLTRWLGVPLEAFVRPEGQAAEIPTFEAELASLLHRHQVPQHTRNLMLFAAQVMAERNRDEAA